jgi:hypothetical protein
MDKFGIFKLIGSLADFYKNQAHNFFGKQRDNGNTQKVDKPPTNFTQTDIKSTTQKDGTPQVLPKPLQENMIKVMTSHDEFIKRVKGCSKNG